MALNYAHGAIQWLSTDSVGTTYAVSGLSFQPKAIRVWCSGIQSASDAVSSSNNIRASIGFAVSTTSRRCVGITSGVSFNPTITSSGACNDGVLCQFSTTDGSRTALLDISAIASDGFTLINDDAPPNSLTVFWEAWGGSDITVAEVIDISEPASTGNVDYTVTGFTSGATNQVVMFAGCQSTAALNSGQAIDGGMCIGFAAGTTTNDNVVVMGNSRDGATTTSTRGYCYTGECLAMQDPSGGSNPNATAVLTAFGADNFRLNWTARGTTGRKYVGLAIKGGQWKSGSYTINGTSGSATATVSGLAFQPIGLSLIGRGKTVSTQGTSTAEARFAIGCGTSTTSRRSLGWLDEDAIASSSQTATAVDYDSVLVHPLDSGAAIASYDINAINADGFQIIVDATGVGTSTEWQGYLTFASATATALAITSVTPSSFDDGVSGIVIAGSGFGSSQGSSTLTIGGQAQTVTGWTDQAITFTCVAATESSNKVMGAQTLKLVKG